MVDLLACGVTVRESSLRCMSIGKACGLRSKGQRRHFCKRRFNWQRRSTTSNGVTCEALRHCYGRHYSDLSPTRCCSEALLCHRSAKKFANGSESSKQAPHGLSSRFRRSDCADRGAVWPRQTSVAKKWTGIEIADHFRAGVTNYRERGYNPTHGCRV